MIDVSWNYEQNRRIPKFRIEPVIRIASLEMHPLDEDDRVPETKEDLGSGMCNIMRCRTEVCPEHIGITDNAIIPMKERVVDRYYDPIVRLGRLLTGKKKRTKSRLKAEAAE